MSVALFLRQNLFGKIPPDLKKDPHSKNYPDGTEVVRSSSLTSCQGKFFTPTVMMSIRVQLFSSHPRSGFPAQLGVVFVRQKRVLLEKFVQRHSAHHIRSCNAENVHVLFPSHRSVSWQFYLNVSACVRIYLK